MKHFNSQNLWSDLKLNLSSGFLAMWPSIIANVLSEILLRFMNIQTSPGLITAIALIVSTLLLSWRTRQRTDPNGKYNKPSLSGTNSKYILMQGGMLSLAMVMSELCKGLLTGPFTSVKLLQATMTLIPALEGALGSQFVFEKNNRLAEYIDTAISELVRKGNSHISERMVTDLASRLAGYKDYHLIPGEEQMSNLVRSRMAYFASFYQQTHRNDLSQIVLDNFRNPSVWRLEAVKAKPSPPPVQPPNPFNAQFAELFNSILGLHIPANEKEKEQLEIFERWVKSGDENELYHLKEHAHQFGLTHTVQKLAAAKLQAIKALTKKSQHQEKAEWILDYILHTPQK